MNEFRVTGVLVATNLLEPGRYGVLMKADNGARVDFVWEADAQTVRQWKQGDSIWVEGEITSMAVEVDAQKMYMIELRPQVVVVGMVDSALLDTLKTEDPLKTEDLDITMKTQDPSKIEDSLATLKTRDPLETGLVTVKTKDPMVTPKIQDPLETGRQRQATLKVTAAERVQGAKLDETIPGG